MKSSTDKSPDAGKLDILKTAFRFRGRGSHALLETLLGKSTETDVAKGAWLFHQGDSGDSMFVVVSGTLSVWISTEKGEQTRVSTMGPGALLGEIQFLTGGRRTAGVVAEEDSRLLVLGRLDCKNLLEENSFFSKELNRIIVSRTRKSRLFAILPRIFGPLGEKELSFIVKQLEWVPLKKGEKLFSQNAPSESFFILVSGRLAVVIRDSQGKIIKLKHRGPGESIGEMGLITGQSRSASVFSLRESQLVRIGKPAFLRILKKYPETNLEFMGGLVKRTRDIESGGEPQLASVGFAILPASPGVDLPEFTRRLAGALSGFGRVLHVSSRRLDTSWGMTGSGQATVEDPRYSRLSAWLDEQESKNGFILYETDPHASQWTTRCLQQADHVLVIGKAGGDPRVKEIEAGLYSTDNPETRPKISLILVHPDDSRLPEGTMRWLSPRLPDVHHHICWNKDRDFERLARFLAGKAIGLVLGGGGARGFAHLGVLKALEEHNIPIDMVCGTSIGAIMGGICALGWDHATRIGNARKNFVERNPLGDYTLPFISLVKSKIIDRHLKQGFGKSEIEDLWLNYFCVSANLSSASLEVHDRGPLWKACRASISLPGILRPVLKRGSLLVDGGVINNLPGDIIREKFGGFIMLVNVSPDNDLKVPETQKKLPSTASYIRSRIHPSGKVLKIPNILDILTRTIVLSSLSHSEQVKKGADHCFEPPVDRYGLLEFKSLEKIMKAGYDHAMKELEDGGFLLRKLNFLTGKET